MSKTVSRTCFLLVLILGAWGVLVYPPVLADEGEAPAEKKLELSGPKEEVSRREASDGTDFFWVAPSLKTYFVKGDRGRFRQDWYVDDQTTGGIEKMILRGRLGETAYEFEGRQLINYDYLARDRKST